MLKVLTIIGARPQIIKASALSRAIRAHFADRITEIIVHTGQHYDENMSSVFFRELDIPAPAYNLHAGSGSHGEQTAKMISGIENVLLQEEPDYVVLFGDTNSTLAGAVAASKIHIPVAHIEAGLRSYNKKMPEEVNRILTDQVSTYLFPPTQIGVENLEKEGFSIQNSPPYTIDNPGIFNVGDIMYDNCLYFSDLAIRQSTILDRLQIKPQEYILCTIHRVENTDDTKRLNAIFTTLLTISVTYSISLVIPLHPRTAKQMRSLLTDDLYKDINNTESIVFLPPVSFFDMLNLQQNTKLIITDSGGVQKEAYFCKKPCIILRAETEWDEIVQNGAAILCDANPSRILDAYAYFDKQLLITFTSLYGDGTAAEKIANILLQ